MKLARLMLPALLAATLCTITARASEPETQVFIDAGELNYVGKLSAEANAKLFALYDAQERKPTTLSIRSQGGAADVGMELGKWVHRNMLDVKVLEECYSSCANYVFTAARKKVVSNFAIIGHDDSLGNLTLTMDDATAAYFAKELKLGEQMLRKEVIDALRKLIDPQLVREEEFFKEIGVQRKISTLGQAEKYRRIAPEDAVGWYYSIEGFAKLGVSNITVINPPWQPERNPGPHKVFKITVK